MLNKVAETRPESLSHYNEEYHVYRAFLDKDYLAYTMGCFGVDSYGPELKDISLEQAQMKKYELPGLWFWRIVKISAGNLSQY